MGVIGELGLFPLSIEIYTRMMKYLFDLGHLLKEGNPLILSLAMQLLNVKKMIVHNINRHVGLHPYYIS